VHRRSGNNLANPSWGRTNTQYLRVAPANYADGIKKPVAGPPSRYVSNRVFNDSSQNLFSENGVTQWGFVWGQFMDHTFGLRQENGGENAPIAFNAGDRLESFTNTFGNIAFSRTPAAPEADADAIVGIRRTTLAARLGAIYGDVDKLDAFVGMLAERHVGGSEFGELQRAIWRRQFEALRAGDRFFYLNDPVLPAIRSLFGIDHRRTLAQVIEDNSPGLDVQDNVFEVAEEE
jgi:hypothetical protein